MEIVETSDKLNTIAEFFISIQLYCIILFSHQVYDIAFSRACGGRDLFASVGADGSVRMFDLR